MKLSISLARTLLQLTKQETVPQSQFSDKKQLEKFVDDGLLLINQLSRTKKLVRLKSPDYLQKYLANNFKINDLEKYIEVMADSEAERADFALVAGDSKLKSNSIFSGFFVKAFEEVSGWLNNQEIILRPVPGSFIYINDYKNFKIAEDIIIVVVENFENFKYIESQKDLFPVGRKLFTLRYQNNSLAEWLSDLPNPYLHYGDFDLTGLSIYLSFRNKRKYQNSSFLIPPNIENLIEKYGSRELFFQQQEYTKNQDFASYPEISEIASIINKYQKGLEQEILLRIS